MSAAQVPGLGSGTFAFKTGNHAAFDDACSLNLPMEENKQHYQLVKNVYEMSLCSREFSGKWETTIKNSENFVILLVVCWMKE